jgi:diaminopimelate decarboxylase
MKKPIPPSHWGLLTRGSGELALGNHGLASIARSFGTPLFVFDMRKLLRTAGHVVHDAAALYRGTMTVYFPMKCNSVPGVIEQIVRAGMRLEVMTPFELDFALRLGVPPCDIIANGPCKSLAFLEECVVRRIRLIVVDSVAELYDIEELSSARHVSSSILLRVNPDVRPAGISAGSATGSRSGCAFGLDLAGGEVRNALARISSLPHLRFAGYHMHIGTGLKRPAEYRRAIKRLEAALAQARDAGYAVEVVDVGGGFGTPASYEVRPGQMVRASLLHRMIPEPDPTGCPGCGEFIRAIAGAVEELFAGETLPEIIIEPGRSIVGPCGFLLLTIERVKTRPGAGRWLIADGGISTVALPMFYERHSAFLCDDALRAVLSPVTIVGPACFGGDVLYRNIPFPAVNAGEVIAIMDAGAYFLQFESSFGFPRSAVAGINGSQCRLMRVREDAEMMLARDLMD